MKSLLIVALAALLFVGCETPLPANRNADADWRKINFEVSYSRGRQASALKSVLGEPDAMRSLGEFEIWEWKHPSGNTFAWVAVKGDRVVDYSKSGTNWRTYETPEAWHDKELSMLAKIAADIAAETEAIKAAARKRRDDYLAEHPDLPEKTRERIAAGKVGTGMSADDLEASWGKPERKKITAGKFGRREQWVYGDPDNTRIYLQNGKVISWSFTER